VEQKAEKMTGNITEAHIEKIKKGSPEAWGFVKENFETGLYSRAVRLLQGSQLSGQVSADDLVQETWLKAWDRICTFRGTRVPELIKWLLAILKNTFIDKCRKGRFELSAPVNLENTIGPTMTPSETVRLQERDTRVTAILAKLDRMTREIITLKHFEGLTFREIGEMLGKNPNSVASIYRRAMAGLKNKLSDGSSASILRI
jgi:RNA polymerase sigma-70 factor (ECF subfamily)